MNFHPTETFIGQGADSLLRQRVYRQNVLGYKKIWPRILNVLLALSSMVLLANLWLCQNIARMDMALQAAEDIRHELTERQISLLAIRDEVYSPDHVLLLASQTLDLQTPDSEQVKKFE